MTSPSLRGCKRFSIGSGPENRTILTVISADLIDPVISLIQESCGDLEKPATGIIFTLPVDRVVGLARPQLGENLGG